MKEHGAKIGETERSAIEGAITTVKDALKGEDPDFIRTKTEALLQASLKLGEAMYKGMNNAENASGDAPGGDEAGPSAGAAEGDVVDADYEEVDEEKKKKGGAR
jgi:molecular chaperone DnaK